MIFAVATVLVITGLEGWSSLAWLGGAGLLVGLAIIRKGYWHPKIMAQITTAAGALGALGIIALLVAFNLLLSAAFLGGGVLLGILWRIIS